MKTKITLNLNIGKFQGQCMSMKIISDGYCLYDQSEFKSQQESITLEIDLPATLSIVLNNRRDSDVLLDSDNNFITDKHILLKSICIFDTVVDSYNLPKDILYYSNDQGKIIEPAYYWNSNGVATIQFDEADPLVWLFKHQEVW